MHVCVQSIGLDTREFSRENNSLDLQCSMQLYTHQVQCINLHPRCSVVAYSYLVLSCNAPLELHLAISEL